MLVHNILYRPPEIVQGTEICMVNVIVNGTSWNSYLQQSQVAFTMDMLCANHLFKWMNWVSKANCRVERLGLKEGIHFIIILKYSFMKYSFMCIVHTDRLIIFIFWATYCDGVSSCKTHQWWNLISVFRAYDSQSPY